MRKLTLSIVFLLAVSVTGFGQDGQTVSGQVYVNTEWGRSGIRNVYVYLTAQQHGDPFGDPADPPCAYAGITRVTITSVFGYYSFTDLESQYACEYFVEVGDSRRYTFTPSPYVGLPYHFLTGSNLPWTNRDFVGTE